MAPENARPSKKNWTRKKRMASWARQRQQITEAADGGARARRSRRAELAARTGGLRAALARGQMTRAGQHYYSHLGLRPASKGFDYNQPLIRKGPTTILLRNGQKKLVRSLQGGASWAKASSATSTLVHVPVIICSGRWRPCCGRPDPAAPTSLTLRSCASA